MSKGKEDKKKTAQIEEEKKTGDREMIRRYYKAEIRNVDPKKFTVDALVSDETVDRHGTIILKDAWKKDLRHYREHPVLLSSHSYGQLMANIGSAERVQITGDGLECRFKYFVGEGNPEADWAFNLASKGLAMFSVGFLAHEWEDKWEEAQKTKDRKKAAWRIYKRVELAEVSQVVVGSNRNALQRMIEDGADEPDMGLSVIDGNAYHRAIDLNVLAGLAREILDQLPEEEKSPQDSFEGLTRALVGADALDEMVDGIKKDLKGPLGETLDKAVMDALTKEDNVECECIECGHTEEIEGHCDELECSECGGQMRRVERPGPGKKIVDEIEEIVDEEKTEGVLEREAFINEIIRAMKIELDVEGGEFINTFEAIRARVGEVVDRTFDFEEERPYISEHACRLRDPAEFKKDSFRRGSRTHEGKKYSVIMGKLKGKDTMTDQAFRYDIKSWDEDEARSHCKDHKGKFEAAAKKDVPRATIPVKIEIQWDDDDRKKVEELSSAISALNEKLGLFSVDELKGLLGNREDIGGRSGNDPSELEAEDITEEILTGKKVEDEDRSSSLSEIVKEAQRTRDIVKGLGK